MAGSLNKVSLIGNLGKEPIFKEQFTPTTCINFGSFMIFVGNVVDYEKSVEFNKSNKIIYSDGHIVFLKLDEVK